MQKITESIQPIVSTLQHVTIQKEAIQDFARHYTKASHEEKATSLEGYLENATEEEHIAFVIVTSAINFYFWGEPKWAIKIGDKKLGGSLSMFYCIKRAYEEGLKMTDPIVLATLDEEKLATAFKGENTIPLLPERAQLLRELG